MRTTKQKIILLIVTAQLSSCCRQSFPQPPSQPTETTVITETVHDTTVVVRQDSAAIQALIECDSTGQAYIAQILELQSGTKVRQHLELNQGILQATAEVDSIQIYLTFKQRDKQTVKYVTVEKPVIVETNVIRPWQKFLMMLGAILIAATVIRLIIRFVPR